MRLIKIFVLVAATFLTINSHICSASGDKNSETTKNQETEEDRSMKTVLNPLAGVWQATSRMLGKGVHKFRQSLQEGVKVANLLQDDMTEGVSQLVIQSIIKDKGAQSTLSSLASQLGIFQDERPNASAYTDQELLREGVVGGLLKFFGVNSNQLGVVALNVLIILAEWITSSLLGSDENSITQSRMMKENLMEWVNKGHSPKLENILHEARSRTLPENLIDTLKGKTGNSTACVQLLICKITPVIWRVQDTLEHQLHSLTGKTKKPGDTNSADTNKNLTKEDLENEARAIPTFTDTLSKIIPPRDVFIGHGDQCEKRFAGCKLLKFNVNSNKTST